jgi:hypothetical protein
VTHLDPRVRLFARSHRCFSKFSTSRYLRVEVMIRTQLITF